MGVFLVVFFFSKKRSDIFPGFKSCNINEVMYIFCMCEGVLKLLRMLSGSMGGAKIFPQSLLVINNCSMKA